jgi:hypothetical protein
MIAIAALVALAIKAGAADPSTMPTTVASAGTMPATTHVAATRYVAVIPPGFHLLAVAGHEAICMAAADTWVKPGLQQAAPATRPTTMPADILNRLDIRHDALAREMTSDLALTDPKLAAKFLDEVLRPALKKQAGATPRLIFLVATKQQIVDLLKGGWKEPHFHYNPYTGEPSIDQGVRADDEGKWDDIIWPFAVNDSHATDAQKQSALSEVVQRMETNIAATVADKAPETLYSGFQAFVYEEGIAKLHLRLDEQWFNLGVTEVLSCKYVGELWDVPYAQLVGQRSQQLDPRINPVPLANVDALHPMAMQDIQPERQAFYVDALRRKSTAAVNQLVINGHEEAIGQVIAKLRLTAPTSGPATQPADGAGLVDMIKTLTGVDLTANLSR